MTIIKRLFNSNNNNLQCMRYVSEFKLRNWYANLVRWRQPRPPYSHIIQIGDPTLRLMCTEVEEGQIKSENVQRIIRRMKDVFCAYHCYGLAASQVGIPLRIILVAFTLQDLAKFSKEEIALKEMAVMAPTVLINPVITITDFSKHTFPESCASVLGFSGDVPRYKSLEVEGLDEFGKVKFLRLKGWNARIIQHEIDHLDGNMYTDFMLRKSFTCGCWHEVNQNAGKVHIPFRPM